jgi:hypothetical protein
VARPKKHPDRVELLTSAAQILDTGGNPDEAEAVRDALTELTRVKARADNPTLSLWTYPETWRAAQQAGSIPDLIDEGFKALLAGSFTPKKAPRSAGGGRATFSGRADVERRQAVTAYIKAHADELGWTPSPQQVAAAWLEYKFGPYKRT